MIKKQQKHKCAKCEKKKKELKKKQVAETKE